jgi:hypothetical protein
MSIRSSNSASDGSDAEQKRFVRENEKDVDETEELLSVDAKGLGYGQNRNRDDHNDEEDDEEKNEDEDMSDDGEKSYEDEEEEVDQVDAEQQKIEEDEEEYLMARERSIMALPPKLMPYEDSHLEVSASPAFHVLDALFNEGKLTATKLMLLKEKYTELHESLKNKRNNEQRLLQQAKEFANTLARQKVELDKAEMFPDNSNTEMSRLRQNLLSYHNDLAETEERQYQLDYKIRCLEEDRKMVEKDYNRVPKQAETEKRIEELRVMGVELRKEISHRTQEIKSLKEDLEINIRQNQLKAKELEAAHEQIDTLKGDLVAVNSLPSQISKEADRFDRQKTEAEKTAKEIDSEIHVLHTQLQAAVNKLQQLENDKAQYAAEMRRFEVTFGEKEREFQVLSKDLEYAKERETVLLVDRTTLDLNLRHINSELASAHEKHTRILRDKDSDMRKLKKAELQLKVTRDNVEHISQTYEKKKAEATMLPKDDGTLQKQIEELKKEVDHHKRANAKQAGLTKQEVEKIEQSVAEEERLLYEQSDLRVEVVELTRLAAIKRDEQAQKKRDLQRAEQHYVQVQQDVLIKQLQIDDHKKKDQEMQTRLKDFAQLYDVIKNDRNKCVSLIQASTQKASEMREKVKIFENEMEILRTSALQKEKQLQKHRLKHVNSLIVRDSLRGEVSKQRAILAEMQEKQDQLRIDIAKLNLLINHSEEQMVQLRKQYEQEIQKRNDRGVQLIERNEEVCIFYEKLNIQDQVIRNGDVELCAKQEEIRFLKMQLAEEQRTVNLLRKSMPSKRQTEQELVTLQIELSQCQDHQRQLEQQIENPKSEDRLHFVEGKDLQPVELQAKIDHIEERLAAKEEQCLEKDLIHEQVSRLTDRAAIKVNASKDDTLSLAKKVNTLQGQIKRMTRQMMAKVSELSVQQATAMRLQQEVKEKEAFLEAYYINMEKGLPPSADIEREYLRQLQVEEQRQQDREATKAMLEREQMYTMPGGVVSTAEPRPNAYIPTEEHELPIPRPYGGHAPFRPTEVGTNMRHIRKPITKPIEI